jgi:hypothetical protein
MLLLLLGLATTNAHAFFFPEMPFCPLGGPPGWFNRITNNHHSYRHYPPRMYSPAPYYQPRWQNPPPASNACGTYGRPCRWR